MPVAETHRNSFRRIAAVFALCVFLCSVPTAAFSIDWPTTGWLTATPAEMGMDQTLLDQARTYALTGGGSGFITRGGRLVMSWGDTQQLYDLYSTTKSIGVSVLGLALQDGRVALDDAAQLHLPDVGVPPDTNLATGWLDDITLEHLATHTAGFEKTRGFGSLLFQPGTTWSYSDGGANWLADVLTVVYGDDLNTVLFDRLLAVLGITSADLVWSDSTGRGNTINGIKRRAFNAGIFANVDAMARIGYLYLRGGSWDGTVILPQNFVDQASQFNFSILHLPVSEPSEHFNATDHYGLLWWNNADGSLAGVPTDAYWAWGLGDSLIIVIPSLDIVVARAGNGWRPGWTSDYSVVAPFIQPIVQSVAPVAGNLAPAANDDSFSVGENSSANPLAVFEDNGSGVDSDPDFDAISIIKVGTPDAGGSVAPNATNDALIYSPAVGFTGVESFKYTIADGNGGINTAIVNVTVGGGFQQDGSGLVSMEAEHYYANVVGPDGHAWSSVGGSFPGFSGTDALQALPEDAVSYSDPGYSSLSPQLDYQVNFVATGTHYVWVRAWGPSTSSNSLHVGLDGQELSTSGNMRLPNNQTSGYVWVSTISGGARATLDISTAGEHAVNVWMRESGTVADKVVLTTDAGYDPSNINGGLGPDESGRTAPTDADLSVAKTVDNAAPLEGDTIVYTVTVTNNGPSDAQGVVLSDQLPVGLTYVSDDSGGAYDSGTGLWTVGTLANGNLATLNITATVVAGTAGSTLTNTASVSALNELDPVTGNDSASVGLTVASPGGGGTFQQDSGPAGVVSMEAESYYANVVAPDGHAWLSAGGSFPGFAGTDALQALPEDAVSYSDPGYSGLSPQLDYQVNFVATGTHYVWVRAWGPTSSSNSLHVGLDGQELSTSGNMTVPNGGYLWVSTVSGGARSTVDVSAAGDHTLNVWMRESGMVVDKVVLTTDPLYNPATINGGLGPDESGPAGLTVESPVISSERRRVHGPGQCKLVDGYLRGGDPLYG